MSAAPDGTPNDVPFEVERVEWVPGTAEALEVHVLGRWRAAIPSDPTLTLYDERGDKRRFRMSSATVDPLTGVWHARFSVPVELRSRLTARLVLKGDGRKVQLPAASPGPVEGITAPPPATVVESAVLAQRRALREGAADEGLVRRAQAAESTVSTLETQLDHLESRLRAATGERERLAARLRAAEQREESERRVRSEAEEEREELKARSERELSQLRARARSAEEQAQTLGREMIGLRRQASEAQQAAAAAARGGAGPDTQAELDRLTTEAAELSRRLEGERTRRATAEAQLTRQSERVTEVESTVALLEQELSRRATVQTSVQSEIEGLREALVAVRAQTLDSASRDSGAQRALTDLQSTAAGLRERLTGLERAERAARTELQTAQSELAARARDLERARIDVERSRAELASAHAAQDSTTAALREAERTVVSVRAEAAELQARLDDERRRRFEAEGTLKAEMARERERWGGQLAEIEGALHARIAGERHAFEQQAAEIGAIVVALRQRLSTAGADLDDQLEADRAARDAAFAERDAALAQLERIKLEVAVDLEHAADEREQLLARVADAEALVATAREELAAARGETDTIRSEIDRRSLEIGAELATRLADVEAERDDLLVRLDSREDELARLRTETADAAASNAAIEALVADVVATAASLRDSFDQQLAELQARVERELSALRGQLDEERSARIVAEQELAAERARGVVPADVPSALDAMTRTELETARRELAATQEELAAERRRAGETGELPTAKLVADLEASRARLKEQRSELEAEGLTLPGAPSELPGAGASSNGVAPTLGETAPPDGPADVATPPGEPTIFPVQPSLVDTDLPPAEPLTGDVSAAAQPLDAQDAGFVPLDVESLDVVSPAEEAETAEVEAVEVEPRFARDAPAEDDVELDEVPALEEAPAAEVDPEAEPPLTERPFGRPPMRANGDLPAPSGSRLVNTRFVRPSDRPLTGWLTPALNALAQRDAELGAEAIVELLPAQGGMVRDVLRYALTIEGFGSYTVDVGRDAATVTPVESVDPSLVHVSGQPGALAPLVAGGARRRLPGVRIDGRKRRLRKVLRGRRAPLDFARLADHDVRPSPELALAILCAGVEPTWTAGHSFTIVYQLAGAEPLAVQVRDGRELVVGPAADAPEEEPIATLTLREDALFPMLARLHLPHGGERVMAAGDRHAVALLHGWFDRIQGLPGA